MKDFIEGIIVMVGFLLIVVGIDLSLKWHEHNEMDRQLELWKRDLVEARNAEAKKL